MSLDTLGRLSRLFDCEIGGEMGRQFGYITDLDERGEYQAHVLDMDTDEIIMAIQNDEDGSLYLVADGFMKHVDDMAGLLWHMVDVGLAHKGDTLEKITR
jgi:hypothetical protein